MTGNAPQDKPGSHASVRPASETFGPFGRNLRTGRSVNISEGAGASRASNDCMPDDDIVAIGLLTRAHLGMLGSSLKTVFHVDDDAAQFEELLEALDRVGERRQQS
jgi:hypothetical protein